MARRSGAPSVPTKRRPCAGLPMKVRRKVSATPATFVASRPSNSSRLSTGGSCLPKQAGDAWMDCRWRTTPIRLLTGRTARPSRSSTRGRDGIVRLSQKGKGPRGQALSHCMILPDPGAVFLPFWLAEILLFVYDPVKMLSIFSNSFLHHLSCSNELFLPAFLHCTLFILLTLSQEGIWVKSPNLETAC